MGGMKQTSQDDGSIKTEEMESGGYIPLLKLTFFDKAIRLLAKIGYMI